jgi:prevent-host-death family protein
VEVSVKDLRTQARRLLEAVERGEEVVITFRGKARARVVPFGEASPRPVEEELFGIWRDHPETEDVEGYVDRLRKGRHECSSIPTS